MIVTFAPLFLIFCLSGATNIHVSGFSDTFNFTSNLESFSFGSSIQAQCQWEEDFAAEQKNRELRAKLRSDLAKCKPDEHDLRESIEQQLEAVGPADFLPVPVGWPLMEEPDQEEPNASGIPSADLIMQVDFQVASTKDANLMAFKSSFGNLPARATLMLTQLLYHSNNVHRSADGQPLQLPVDIFLPDAVLLSEFDRLRCFTPSTNTLENFCMAGYHTKQQSRMMAVLREMPDPRHKIQLYREYIECCVNQHHTLVLNGNLHSQHALSTVLYVEQAKEFVCRDLQTLVYGLYSTDGQVASRPLSVQYNPDDEVLCDRNSPLYWKYTCADSFVLHNFLMDHCMSEHNRHFFDLTPTNLKICNEV